MDPTRYWLRTPLFDGLGETVIALVIPDNTLIPLAVEGESNLLLIIALIIVLGVGAQVLAAVIARVNNPDNAAAFEELGVQTLSSAMTTAWGIDNMIERPALSNWMTELGRSGDVQEIEVTAEKLVGRTIADIDDDIPNEVLIALVARNGESTVPRGDFELEYGDRITNLGQTEAVAKAIERVHPHM